MTTVEEGKPTESQTENFPADWNFLYTTISINSAIVFQVSRKQEYPILKEMSSVIH